MSCLGMQYLLLDNKSNIVFLLKPINIPEETKEDFVEIIPCLYCYSILFFRKLYELTRGSNMKYLTLTIALFSTMLFAKDNKTTLKVEGMQCQYSCTGKVATVVENIKGVKECTVDFEKGFATVVFDEQKLASKDIVDVLTEKTSYKVSEMKQQDTKKETGSI